MNRLEEALAVAADNLRAAGEHEKADAVQAAAAHLEDAINSSSPDLYDDLYTLCYNADLIMRIILDMPPAPPADDGYTKVATVSRGEARRRANHSRGTT